MGEPSRDRSAGLHHDSPARANASGHGAACGNARPGFRPDADGTARAAASRIRAGRPARKASAATSAPTAASP